MVALRVEEQGIATRAQAGVVLPDEVGPRRFEVICIRAGEANGLSYSAAVLRRSVEEGLWEGCDVFVNHPGPADAGRAGGRAVEDVAGVLADVRFSMGSVIGCITFAGPKAEMVVALAREIVLAQDELRPAPNVGLSADLYVEVRPGTKEVARIVRVNSLDVVCNPAAGGAFLRVINSIGGYVMEEVSQVAEQERADEPVQLALELREARRELDEARQSLDRHRGELLEVALRTSGLPAPLKEEVRAQLGGASYRPDELERLLATKQQTWAKLMEGRVIQGAGGRWQMRDGLDRIRLAAERLFGLPVPEDALSIERLSGVRELYLRLTGDEEFHGNLRPERVQLANVTTATMMSVTADVLNKVMLQAYNRREHWWDPIVTHRDLQRFQQMKMIRVYGFSSLSTVAEGGAYTEKTWGDLQETATIVKKGNFVGITMEMLMADDTDAVRAIPQLLGSAAYNTVSDTVAGVFTAGGGVGPLMADGVALFDGTRNNLGATALDFDSFDAGQTAIMSQTEPGSARKLGTPARYLLVPVQLRSTGMVLRNSINQPGGSANDVNPWYDDFEVLVVPPWADTNNWALATDPAVAEHVVLGWLQGREPQIFAATDEVAGSMFSNDELRVKVRFFICCGVADYRGLYKANVA